MQLDWLETFLDLCETRSFTRTADRLRVTQSTVSARIRALESALGCRLLQRSRAGTALTTEGCGSNPTPARSATAGPRRSTPCAARATRRWSCASAFSAIWQSTTSVTG
jgi:hypothetical protein